MNILCPKCKKEQALSKRFCDCGFEIREEEGIYILTTEKDFNVNKEDIPYIPYSYMAKYYDKTREVDSKVYLETAKLIHKSYLNPDSVVLDLGAGTGVLGYHMAKLGTTLLQAIYPSKC